MTYMEAHHYLLKFGIRPSVQRTAVMEYLMNFKSHPTVEEIYVALSPSIQTLSKTTVYNTLNLFHKMGAVQTLSIDDKNLRFDADVTRHAHFYCRNCGQVHDIFDVNQEYFNIPGNEKFKIDAVEISYYGQCNTCKGS